MSAPTGLVVPPRNLAPFWLSGRYYGTDSHLASNYAAGGAQNGNLRAYPIYVPSACSIDRIGAEVTTGSAGKSIRLGIALPNGAGNLPGTIILDSGAIDATSTGVVEATVAATLPAGLVWGLVTGEDATIRLRGVTNTNRVGILGKTSPASSATFGYGLVMNHTWGALPAAFSGSTTTNDHTVINVRVV